MRDLGAISAKNTEAVAVEMNRMPPCRVVVDGKDVASAKFQGQQWRHVRVALTGHRLTVDGPDAVGHSTHSHHPAATYHPAAAHQAAAPHHASLQLEVM